MDIVLNESKNVGFNNGFWHHIEDGINFSVQIRK